MNESHGHGPVTLAVLMPHAPILVPSVGKDRLPEVDSSVRAMREISREVVRTEPATIVLISPHTPRQPMAFPAWAQERVRGTFAPFGAPGEVVDLPVDAEFLQKLSAIAPRSGATVQGMHGDALDHGALVPLWFLHEAGWRGPVVILGLNWPGAGGLRALGQAIAATAKETGRKIAIVASGDMSHRLIPGAPAGYEPSAKQFDQTFVETLRRRAYRDVDRIDPGLQNRAAEDVVDSTVVALSAVDWASDGGRVLSYEGPFGVGYTVAILYSADADCSHMPSDAADLPRIARRSVDSAFHQGVAVPPAPVSDYLRQKAGVFVTIRTRGGALRGCVGTLHPPASPNIVEETWRNAQLAAFRDARFRPVDAMELHNLRFGISVLHSFEEVSSPSELDPARFGVIVKAADGRQATLLPGIAGIDTRERQMAAVCEKAGIDPAGSLFIVRYQVDKYAEEGFVD
jgi:AmmeMemoRadiSam system protein A